MKNNTFRILLISLLFILSLTSAQAAEKSDSKKLNIGLVVSPPFVMQERGEWQGLSLDLWKEVAEKMEVSYHYQPFTNMTDLLQAVDSGQMDVGISNISVTTEREKRLDFTHSYFGGGPGIVLFDAPPSAFSMISNLFNWQIIKLISLVFFVLVTLGLILWLLEKRQGSEEFQEGPVKGIGHGFWLSAVTLTTVGFGEQAPKTLAGRAVALIWMFSSVILISGLTATITSALTVKTLDNKINNIQDLKGQRVGTAEGTTSDSYMNLLNVQHSNYPDIVDAFAKLQKHELDAVVYDTPVLQYMVTQSQGKNLRVLPDLGPIEQYAFVVKEKSPLREKINRHMISSLNAIEWQATRKKYFE